jgi:uncharacterized RDD family membrane protein YckC
MSEPSLARAVAAPSAVEALVEKTDVIELLMRRSVGAVIDLVVLFVFLMIPDGLLGNERYRETLWIWLGLELLYFPLTEGFFGRTVGKLLMGIVVVDAAGGPPGPWRGALRTLLRFFEVNPLVLGGIPAAIAVAASQRHQRLGDMLAGTYVLRAKDLPPHTARAPTAVERTIEQSSSTCCCGAGLGRSSTSSCCFRFC